MSLLDSAHDETKINCSELKKNNLISFEFLKSSIKFSTLSDIFCNAWKL